MSPRPHWPPLTEPGDPLMRPLARVGRAVLCQALADATDERLPEARRRGALAWLRRPSVERDFWIWAARVPLDRLLSPREPFPPSRDPGDAR
jgi:hypothetical protein